MILIITNKYHNSFHPNALRIKSIVKALRAEAKAVHVLEQAGENANKMEGEFGEVIYRSSHPNWEMIQKGSRTSRFARWIFRMKHGQSLNEYIGFECLSNPEDYKVILSTGPSFNSFQIAFKLKKLSGAKWIADYRDLWSGDRIKRNHLSRQILSLLEKRKEKKTVPYSDLITTVTLGMANQIKSLFINKRVEVIANGYDDELNSINFSSPKKDHLIISYLGNIYPNQDSNNIFMREAIKLSREYNTELRFVGTDFNDRNISESANLKILPWQSGEEFKSELVNSHAFIHFTPSGVNVMATTKIYAYLRTGKPIILVEPEEGELLDLAKICSRLYLVRTVHDLRLAIEELVNSLKDDSIFSSPLKNVEHLSREYQTNKMVKLIGELL